MLSLKGERGNWSEEEYGANGVEDKSGDTRREELGVIGYVDGLPTSSVKQSGPRVRKMEGNTKEVVHASLIVH
jgi:hypothetical protein